LPQPQTYDPNFPFCLQTYGIGGNYIDCSYTSLAQCNVSASGRAAQCFINPYFASASAHRLLAAAPRLLKLANEIEDEGCEWLDTNTIGAEGCHHQLEKTIAEAVESILAANSKAA
jgi:Protein of unknown function (DUF3551)